MADIVPLTPLTRQLMEQRGQLPASTQADPWQTATDKQRKVALAREEFLRPILSLMDRGVSANVAIRNVLARIDGAQVPERYLAISKQLARRNKPAPGRSTIQDWIKAYRERGKVGLLDSHTGRVRKDRGWEAVAIQLYNIPSKPAFADVAKQLREVYGFDAKIATDSAVARYLKSLPARLNTNSPARLGAHHFALNRKNYISRTTDIVMVGEIYEGDGHTVDAYVAHPNTGLVYRPELTVWIDIRSHYIVGWYWSDAESSLSTLFALSFAMVSHDHVPAWVHIDNGSGYKSKLMSDESLGFYAKFNISQTTALPGNSKGKGLIEHWFRTYRDQHDKFWNNGQDYCGHDQSEDTNRRITDLIKQGKRQLLSLDEYKQSAAAYIERYNHRPQKSLGGKSPAELWSTLQRVPLEIPAAAVIRPRVQRIVERCMVRLDNRKYEHNCLIDYHGKKLVVEYCVHDDGKVWVFDQHSRLICEATLKTKVDWLPQSRLDEARQKREQGRIQRLQKKIDLVRAEEANNIDHEAVVQTLEHWEEIAESDDASTENPFSIDINDVDFFD